MVKHGRDVDLDLRAGDELEDLRDLVVGKHGGDKLGHDIRKVLCFDKFNYSGFSMHTTITDQEFDFFPGAFKIGVGNAFEVSHHAVYQQGQEWTGEEVVAVLRELLQSRFQLREEEKTRYRFALAQVHGVQKVHVQDLDLDEGAWVNDDPHDVLPGIDTN